ncbi:MAG: hypothetical protein J6V09_04640 [Clostridia bacterium]|nr:hypothetical protein [Clostridia bacterium]
MDNGIFRFLKENKKVAGIVLLLVFGVMLILFSSPKKEAAVDEKDLSLGEYKEMLEAELASMCSDVQGVGACRVFVTFERGEQNSYKGSALIESKPPKVDGVTVICKGADSVRVRGELTDMLSALFGIGSHRIAILKLNS